MTDDGPTEPATDAFFAATRSEDVLELERAGTEWLSTGWRGGRTRADAAYSCTVPADWRCDDVSAFVDDRLRERGVPEARAAAAARGDAPVLLTGVATRHARGARLGPVEAYATAGVSNPAALPTDRDALRAPDVVDATEGDVDGDRERDEPDRDDGLPDGEFVPGTVNVVVGTTRDLAPGALANLVAIAAEARATTLLDRVGVPGTTSDAVVAACDPDGERAAFSGSATRVGGAARACVRDAVTAALDARYDDADPPASVADARYGVTTDARATVFRPDG
ncbi:adenosylcobinamide amidohydrolase [Halorubellus sp. PRR65]|uniref:adenosylcobinamide amidohydrolase n=1 Tax=Halorubellus sp. PRR65 TaxID=3098148 RepID=UPI002B25F57D|nr:adenosylcobinamide amidohydrolase [Halorubellus sp. PRR65]